LRKDCSALTLEVYNKVWYPTAKFGANIQSTCHTKILKPNRISGVTSRGLIMSDIAERIKKIVVEHLDVEAEKVKESASFIDDLGADSLDNVELVMAFEEEFDVEIPDDAAETIQTVGDAIKFVEGAKA
jgi:acyl carrier protein